MRGLWIAVAAAVAVMGVSSLAQASGDMEAGKTKAAKCIACHGKKGEGKGDNPALAGTEAGTFVEAMKAYQSGEREHTMMNMLAKKLSEADIEDLAAYYASLE